MLLDDIRWALEFADRIVVLLGGVSLECAPTNEIFEILGILFLSY